MRIAGNGHLVKKALRTSYYAVTLPGDCHGVAKQLLAMTYSALHGRPQRGISLPSGSPHCSDTQNIEIIIVED